MDGRILDLYGEIKGEELMKKAYAAPAFTMEIFETSDIITVSGPLTYIDRSADGGELVSYDVDRMYLD